MNKEWCYTINIKCHLFPSFIWHTEQERFDIIDCMNSLNAIFMCSFELETFGPHWLSLYRWTIPSNPFCGLQKKENQVLNGMRARILLHMTPGWGGKCICDISWKGKVFWRWKKKKTFWYRLQRLFLPFPFGITCFNESCTLVQDQKRIYWFRADFKHQHNDKRLSSTTTDNSCVEREDGKLLSCSLWHHKQRIPSHIHTYVVSETAYLFTI